ncbi:MAG: glutamate 5-kinase [Lentisphaeria bacterium]|nr:glutamate 5-kinase [Lentisphaeria bacterium]
MTEKCILRSNAIGTAKKIIVKAGTRLLIDRESIAKIVSGIAKLRNAGHQVLLVSSGAVGMGMELAKVPRRPAELAQKQALAALGQTRLMSIYSEECAKHGFSAAQLLLTAADLRNRSRYLNVMNCINALWEKDILPIANENDSVSIAELKFGDNDTLAGMLTSVADADLTILLTTVDGLRDRDQEGNLAERISCVKKVNDQIRSLAGGTDDSNLSIGGMDSKLRAAELATAAGATLWIADGRDPEVFDRILAGEDIGTIFLPRNHRVPGRKRWLGFFSKISGALIIDNGAAKALISGGKSLLPSGIIAVKGVFRRGDTVEIINLEQKTIARGLVNFDAKDCLLLCGKHSYEVVDIMGKESETEAVHRDNLVLLEE